MSAEDEPREYMYRERCLKEKGSECTVCGAVEGIVVHHVDGERENNSLENLIPVCTGCHSDIHGRKERVSGWVKKLGYEPRTGETVTVEVDKETWKQLNRRKERPGESFEDVLRRLL